MARLCLEGDQGEQILEGEVEEGPDWEEAGGGQGEQHVPVDGLVNDGEDYGGLPGGGGPGPQLAGGVGGEGLMVSTSTATPDSMRGWYRMVKVTSTTFLSPCVGRARRARGMLESPVQPTRAVSSRQHTT